MPWGINNHMGSKMTSNLFGMQKVMQALERYNLYFLDSVTIGNTQGDARRARHWREGDQTEGIPRRFAK